MNVLNCCRALPRPFRLHIRSGLVVFGIAFAMGLLGGCGSGGKSPVAPPASACVSAQAPATRVPLLYTSDAGLGALDGFSLAINSITLTDACGNSVTAFTPKAASNIYGFTTVEFAHVNGISEPLTVASLPAADYTTATVNYSAVDVAYIYPDSQHFNDSVLQSDVIAAKAVLPSPLHVDGNGTVLTLDTLLTAPVVLGPSGVGNPTVTVKPAFTLTGYKPATTPTNDRDGKVTLRGLVNSVGADTFNMNNSTAVSFDVKVSSQTVYQGIGGLGALPRNVPASVDVALQSDGSLLATRVAVENTATVGSWVGPLVGTYPTGAYQNIIPQLWQQANPVLPGIVSAVYPWQFQFTANTLFQRAGSSVDLTDLPFTPTFASFADVALGQGLSIDWSTQQLVTTEPQTEALSAVLVPRTFSGTITAAVPSDRYTTYTVTLAANDFMQTLSNTSTITAYTNAGTQMEDGAPQVGAAVNIHGLLYRNGGKLSLVADQVRLQQAPQ